jgi:CheY-like chemotaxis protein
MPRLRPVFRLLVVEDDSERLDMFRSWVPSDVHIVWARSAGVAIGLIRRDSSADYGGVLLDHDLQQQVITPDDQDLSGSNVAQELIMNKYFDVPILVHSTNQRAAPRMVSQLRHSGFCVTHLPMYQLTQPLFREWVCEVKELWEAGQA